MPSKTSSSNDVKSQLKTKLTRINDARESSPMAAFAAFPKSITFDGQDPDEHIVLLVRQHPIVLAPKILVAVLMLILPIILLSLLGLSGIKITMGDVSFGIGFAIFWAMMIVTVLATSFFKWYFSVNIVTNERIVDIDFEKTYTDSIAQCLLDKIEDTTVSTPGMWAAIFDYGNVFIQTAAEQREFDFINVPRPRDIQDTINDLLDWRHDNA